MMFLSLAQLNDHSWVNDEQSKKNIRFIIIRRSFVLIKKLLSKYFSVPVAFLISWTFTNVICIWPVNFYPPRQHSSILFFFFFTFHPHLFKTQVTGLRSISLYLLLIHAHTGLLPQLLHFSLVPLRPAFSSSTVSLFLELALFQSIFYVTSF